MITALRRRQQRQTLAKGARYFSITKPFSREPEISGISVASNIRSHLIFGANTDVGKTIVSTGLVRESLRSNAHKQDHITRYIKPLQCGGNDAEFVRGHTIHRSLIDSQVIDSRLQTETIFTWKTPASPHLASRLENYPCSDEQVISAIEQILKSHSTNCDTFIETAGGVLSPSAASPLNKHIRHARCNEVSANMETDQHWGWTTQADLYQRLLLPVVLVGDGRLGGISSTLSALESLILRGYDVHGIVFIQDPSSTDKDFSYSNHLALREYASRKLKLRSGLGKVLLEDPEKSIISLPSLPPLPHPLDPWFQGDETREKFESFHQLLTTRWNQYLQEVYEMRSVGKDMIWWPFTQHGKYSSKNLKETIESSITLIDSAQGDYFHVLDQDTFEQDDKISFQRRALFDGCASWWTQGLGHGDSSLALAAAAAAGRYGHVIFPDVVHSPAVSLCKLLLGPKGPGHEWASRVFFSDDGSTAMEIAVKMGLRKFCVDRNIKMANTSNVKLSICAQKGCYHGDTLGAMHVAEPNIFNIGQHPWYEAKGLFLDFPIVHFRNGILEIVFPDGSIDESRFKNIAAIYDVETRLSTDLLYPLYYDRILKSWDNFEQMPPSSLIASIIVEPLLLGAGGMKFVDPLWQRALIDVARNKHVPVIFDEVATGLYRLGVKSCREIIGVNPDIAAYAKLLTGGLVPMSVTLASDDIFSSFVGDSKSEALLHGHSYSAHPVGCIASIHALEAYNDAISLENRKIPFFDELHVAQLSTLASVEECMSLGTVLALKVRSENGDTSSLVQSLVQRIREKGCFIRPLGDIIYVMTSFVTERDECSTIIHLLQDAIIDEERNQKKNYVHKSNSLCVV